MRIHKHLLEYMTGTWLVRLLVSGGSKHQGWKFWTHTRHELHTHGMGVHACIPTITADMIHL